MGMLRSSFIIVLRSVNAPMLASLSTFCRSPPLPLALCPSVVGSHPEAPRPGLVEGAAFRPQRAPQSKPVSLRRAGDHLFLRSTYLYP